MTLLAPAFLLGLLAIGIPVWLHRLSSENPNRQAFSSVMFLEAGEPRRVLAKRLQYLLLLALRVLVLALLALLFAGLALEGRVQNLVAETARLQVLVLDLSASMSHGDRWARAQDLAEAVIDDLAGSDVAQVVTAGRSVQVTAEPSLDRGTIRRAVAEAEPGPFRVDYGQLVGAVDGLVRSAELPVVVHLVTDAQRSALPARFADLAPRTSVELVIHDASRAGEDNWSLDALMWSGVSGNFVASIHGYAVEDASRTVTLRLNGAEAAEQTVSVAAGETSQVRFEGLELTEGANRVVATLSPGDALSIDDLRYLAVERPAPRPVLLVSGDSRGRTELFLTSALGTLAARAYEIERTAPAALAERELEGYAFIVVADGGALAEGEAEMLRRYAESGGAVLMALGQQSAGLDRAPVTGHGFEPFSQFAAAPGEYLVVGNMDRSHPALGRMDELRSSRFFRHVPLEPAGEDRILIRLEDGAPLLLEHPLGEGRVMIFASSLDREWNDLPVRPVFVPLIAQLSAYLAGDQRRRAEGRLGGTLSARAMGFSGAQIFAPDGSKALGLAGAGAGDDVLVDQVGFYEVVAAGHTELVAVNVDPRESDPIPMEAGALMRWRELAPGADQAPVGDIQLMETPPTELWPWILALLVVAVFVESWVGNWHLRVRRGMAA